MKKNVLFALLFILGASPVLGAAPGSLFGEADLRPEYNLGTKAFDSDNSVEAGYQFSENVSGSYVQGFYTGLSDNTGTHTAIHMQDSYLRARFKNIWQDAGQVFSFGFQSRTYLPFSVASQNAGMILAQRNYLEFAAKVSDTVTLSLSEIPIFHIYNRSATVAADGTVTANPNFENRIYLTASFKVTDAVSFDMPLMLYLTEHRNFAGVNGNTDWLLHIWPELRYALSPQHTVLLAFQGGNMLQSDGQKFTIGDSFSKGIIQVGYVLSL